MPRNTNSTFIHRISRANRLLDTTTNQELIPVAKLARLFMTEWTPEEMPFSSAVRLIKQARRTRAELEAIQDKGEMK